MSDAKDAPGSANEAASWTILRDAMLRIAPSGLGWSHMDPCLAVVFSPHRPVRL